jgi:hypothetical protein
VAIIGSVAAASAEALQSSKAPITKARNRIID